MEVITLQVFVSLMLVGSSVLLFLYSMRKRDHEHADRLALLPMEDDEPTLNDSEFEHSSSHERSHLK